jgi:hypothetical protein
MIAAKGEDPMLDQSSSNPRLAEWLSHVRALSVGIGPRGSTRAWELCSTFVGEVGRE